MTATLDQVGIDHGDPNNYRDGTCKCGDCARAWWADAEAKELVCADCGTQLVRPARGRLPVRCASCNKADIAAKQRAYYEENKADIAAKQRAYYEENKADIAAKQRAKLPPPPDCVGCGRPHARRHGSGRYPRLCVNCAEPGNSGEVV